MLFLNMVITTFMANKIREESEMSQESKKQLPSLDTSSLSKLIEKIEDSKTEALESKH